MPPRADPVNVAVVNDFPIVVAGLLTLLAPYGDRVCTLRRPRGGEAAEPADVVLIDTFATTEGPGRRIEEMARRGPARVVVFSWNTDEQLVQRSLAAGAAGYLPKSLRPIELVEAIEQIHAGKVVRPDLGAVRTHVNAGAATWWPGIEKGLTAREAEMVGLMVRGLSNAEIAEASFLSINSVKTYIRTAYRKMGVATRAQAVLWGIRNGFDVEDLPH